MNKFVSSALLALACAVPVAAVAQHPGPPPGYVHHPEWKKGYHMAPNDWNRGQRIDYHQYHLSAPPNGYEWRQVDGNYVLAAVATGIIASVVMAH